MKLEIVNIDEIYEVLIAYAKGDFSKRIEIYGGEPGRNILATGINMLGEELKVKTVSRNYFSRIYDAISEILIITDLEGNILEVNRIALNYLRKKEIDLVGKPIANYFRNFELFRPGEDIDVDTCEVKHIESHFIGFEKLIPVSGSISCIRDNYGEPQSFLCIVTDISEKIRHERQILKASIQGQEYERKRLAYDLHDSLGQEITSLSAYVKSLKQNLKETTDPEKALEKVEQMIDEMMVSLNEISFNLLPDALQKMSLSHSVASLVTRLKEVYPIEITHQLNMDDFAFKDKNDAALVYRIIQEFANNTVQHSQATELYIKVQNNTMGERGLLVDIKNNGIPFDVRDVIAHRGLNSITTRLEALNTRYDFTSTEDDGTRLKFLVNN